MKKIVLAILALNLIMLATVLLNIPIFREITTFVYLSFVPGFLLLQILKFDKSNIANVLLFSVGLSLAFLMLVGLLINGLYLIGFSSPLSTLPLALVLSLLTTSLLFICYKRNLLDNFTSINLDYKLKKILVNSVILVLPPVLGFLGAFLQNVNMMLLMIALVAVIFVVCSVSNGLISPKIYPLLVFSVALALLLHVVFTSKFLIGFDVNLENFVFSRTYTNGHWEFLNPAIYTAPTVNYNAMLSITILPTIYASLMNVRGEIVFKLLYPFVFALVPVALYQIFEKLIGKLASLVSVFFFVSSVLVFYGVTPISLDRQIVAEFFFVLSIFTLLDKSIPVKNRRLLLILLGTAIAFSHYSIMYIYLGFMFFTYAVSKLKGMKQETLNSIVVLFFFAITTVWYYFSVAPLDSFINFFLGLLSRFSTDLLNPAARSTQTYTSQPVSNIVNSLSLAVFFAANILVVVGILKLLFKPKKTGIDLIGRTIITASAILLFMSFALPNFAPSLNLDRFYAISLLFLAPCFALGSKGLLDIGKSVWKGVSHKNVSELKIDRIQTTILCIVLVSFLLTQSGLVNRVTGNTPLLRSLDLDRLRASNDTKQETILYDAYFPDSDVFGATWLREHRQANSVVFRDSRQEYVLSGYGLIPIHLTEPLKNTTILSQNSLVFLARLNIVDGLVYTYEGKINMTDITPVLSRTNTIYSNGYTEVMYSVP